MMKKYGLFFLFSMLVNTATAASNVEEMLNEYINAWNSHDKAKIANFFAPNVIWYDLTSNKQIAGKEKVASAITDYFMGYVADMYWYKNGDVYIDDNTIIYEWTYGGTFSGNWGDKTINNKVFSLKGISTTTMNDNGKIITQKDYYDMDSFKRAIGVEL